MLVVGILFSKSVGVVPFGSFSSLLFFVSDLIFGWSFWLAGEQETRNGGRGTRDGGRWTGRPGTGDGGQRVEGGCRAQGLWQGSGRKKGLAKKAEKGPLPDNRDRRPSLFLQKITNQFCT